jgi:hypothetical protein
VEASQGYTFISEEEITVHDIPAMKLVYTHIPPPDLESSFQIMWCVLVEEQTFRQVEFSCVPACWSTYEGTFNTMLDSFQVLK